MNKFDKIYKKIITECNNKKTKHVIKEEVDQDNIAKAIDILTTCKDGFRIPPQVKKYLAEVINLLNPQNTSDKNKAEEQVFKFEDKIIKIRKDAGEDTWYFTLTDEDEDIGGLNGEEWISYDNGLEFDNEEGMWDSYEECLKEAKDAAGAIWKDFDFNKFQKIK